MRARTADERTCCAHVRAFVGALVGAHVSSPNRASPSHQRGLRAASARRRSAKRWRSTRTSARGTPRPSPRCTRFVRCPGYAPLPARRRALRRTCSAGVRCGAARCAPPMRPRTREGTCLRGALGVGMAAQSGVGVQRRHRRVEHRVGHHVGLGKRRFRPGGAHYGGRARPGFDAARPVVCGGTANARAHTCRH